MNCKKCKSPYHFDHGCGVAVMAGSSFADHAMRCPGSNLYTPRYSSNIIGSKDYQYMSWESPANVGVCPFCWHELEQEKLNHHQIK